MADTADLLEREQAHLLGLDRVAFLRRLPNYVRLLRGQRQLRDTLAEMQTESESAIAAFVKDENELIDETTAVRRRLAELAPEADDSTEPEPEDWGSHDYSRWTFTLAHFDKLAEQNHSIVYAKIPSDSVETGPLAELVNNILRGKIVRLQYGDAINADDGGHDNMRPDLDELVVTLGNVFERHRHAVQVFETASKTLPGVALARLEHFASNLNPAPVLVELDEDPLDRFNRLLLGAWSLEHPVQKAVAGRQLDDFESRRLDKVVTDLRSQVDLLQTDLMNRLQQEELCRQSQWWRRAGHWIGTKVGEAIVSILVAAVVAAAIGFVSGYLVGHNAGGRGTDSTTSTTLTSVP